ncbi:MAG: hypothetical protein M3162_08875 [Thermoproteota archaeon]|nr:hypothetical protein [Thermoproteota archaeon]
MKKEPKIRIIKNKANNEGSYTFLNDLDNAVSLKSQDGQSNKEIDGKKEVEKLKEVEKKVSITKDRERFSKGLKFTKPSQRNHSSIYE